MSDLTNEDARLAAAQEAGKNVAHHEIKEGYTEPRNWDKDGVHNAGAFSHLAAAGFTRLGARMYSQTFVDAYLHSFPIDSEARVESTTAVVQDHKFKVSNGRGVVFETESWTEAADFQYRNNEAETRVGLPPIFTLWIVDLDGVECKIQTQI